MPKVNVIHFHSLSHTRSKWNVTRVFAMVTPVSQACYLVSAVSNSFLLLFWRLLWSPSIVDIVDRYWYTSCVNWNGLNAESICTKLIAHNALQACYILASHTFFLAGFLSSVHISSIDLTNDLLVSNHSDRHDLSRNYQWYCPIGFEHTD
jgi:hypothetical protein